MAELARADQLVTSLERNKDFFDEIKAAPTAQAKRLVLDRHGYRDIQLADMKAYVEEKGGTWTLPEPNRELSDQELAAVSGGLTDAEISGMAFGLGVAVPVVVASAAAI